jgi:hypothetical protein
MKNFTQFKEENNLGSFVQSILLKCNDEQKEFILRILGTYLGEIDHRVDLFNSLNVLDISDKKEIKRRINLYLNDNQGDVDVLATVNDNELFQESYGKNVLATFFKCLTALGLKDNTMSSEHKGDFLFLYWFPDLEINKVKEVFSRFRSLSLIEIDWSYPTISLFFGLNVNGNFQYGYAYDDLINIGEFKLTTSTLNLLKVSDSKSSLDLRKMISQLNIKDIELALKIQQALNGFDLGYQEKTGILFKDKVLTVAYLGVAKEIEDIKMDFKNYLQKFKWSNNILVSVKAQNLWLYLQIKIK